MTYHFLIALGVGFVVGVIVTLLLTRRDTEWN